MPNKIALKPTLEIESSLGFPTRMLIGFDEVGRGCLAGPVVAAAAVLPDRFDESSEFGQALAQVRDSKLLSESKRESLFPVLCAGLRYFAVGTCSVQEIEQYNILKASQLAMRKALDQLPDELISNAIAIVDGNLIPKVLAEKIETKAYVKGDLKSLTIACASVIAKVVRDREMARLATELPGYGFEIHKGYGTPAHLNALERLKPSPQHRVSFGPVKRWLSSENGLSG